MKGQVQSTEKNKTTEFDFRTIKSFEDACAKENINSAQLPDVSMIPEEFAKPDWGNLDEYKYYPWFGVLSSGFGFSISDYGCDDSGTGVGSHLCTDKREKALYIAEQFEDEYKDYFLYSE